MTMRSWRSSDFDDAAALAGSLLLFELVDEIDEIEETAARSGPDHGGGDGDRKVSLAGPCRDSDIMPGIRLLRIGSSIHFIRVAARRWPLFARIAFKARRFSSCCSPTGPWRIYPVG